MSSDGILLVFSLQLVCLEGMGWWPPSRLSLRAACSSSVEEQATERAVIAGFSENGLAAQFVHNHQRNYRPKCNMPHSEATCGVSGCHNQYNVYPWFRRWVGAGGKYALAKLKMFHVVKVLMMDLYITEEKTRNKMQSIPNLSDNFGWKAANRTAKNLPQILSGLKERANLV